MPLLPFLGVTLVGATTWNTFLLFCGMRLRENWGVVRQYSHQADILIVILLLAAGLWFTWRRIEQRRLGA
jgi:membrane protein DedA with SNARE-associated domain